MNNNVIESLVALGAPTTAYLNPNQSEPQERFIFWSETCVRETISFGNNELTLNGEHFGDNWATLRVECKPTLKYAGGVIQSPLARNHLGITGRSKPIH